MAVSIPVRRRLLIAGAVLVVAAGSVLATVGLSRARQAAEIEAARPLTVGDCVVVSAAAPALVEGRRASCDDDPSYTVGALADMSGSCPTAEYQHFPAPVADRDIAALCLVPNLLAEHCYLLNMPIGLVERAACEAPQARSAADGIVVQVTRKLDVHDQRACPTAGGTFAWPYPSPARTYCTSTVS